VVRYVLAGEALETMYRSVLKHKPWMATLEQYSTVAIGRALVEAVDKRLIPESRGGKDGLRRVPIPSDKPSGKKQGMAADSLGDAVAEKLDRGVKEEKDTASILKTIDLESELQKHVESAVGFKRLKRSEIQKLLESDDPLLRRAGQQLLFSEDFAMAKLLTRLSRTRLRSGLIPEKHKKVIQAGMREVDRDLKARATARRTGE
jgi:hypothetical protein